MLHDPDAGKSYWTDARQALRSAAEDRAFIEVPAANILEDSGIFALFENTGVQAQPFIPDIAEVLQRLLVTTSGARAFPSAISTCLCPGSNFTSSYMTARLHKSALSKH